MTPKKKPENAETPQVRSCGTDQVHQRLLLEDPDYARRRAIVENQAWRAAANRSTGRSGCTEIPVVVHVVYRLAAENISDEQINSQITVLNQDFRKLNGDVSSVPGVFAGLVGDTRVTFKLASTDPSGNPTSGVTRTSTTVNGFTDNDAVKSAGTGGADAWPADRYLNLWVCKLAGGLLGYAQFPGGPGATDGVVITHTGFGTTGTAAAPFNLGRTATHEIGHWLNLRHIWGDDGTGCSGDDFVADTPNQGGPNFGAPTFPHVSCANGPNGDMFMNYMDYVDDAAMVMFTAGQVIRMQAALDGPRSTIGTSSPCGGLPSLKFVDDPVTSFKFRDDPVGTLKFIDDPVTSFKFRDDPIGTLKFRDDPIGSLKFRDDVKLPALDMGKMPAFDQVDPGFGTVVNPGPGAGGRAPFILSTPHHSMAWRGSYPDAYEAALARYEQELAAYRSALEDFAARAEQLSEAEVREANDLYGAYEGLLAEYEEFRAGGGQ